MKANTVRELIESIRGYGKQTAYVENGKAFSYDEVCESALRLARQIGKMGLTGKHIGIWGNNSVGWVVAYLAVLSGAGIAVPLPTSASKEEIDRLTALTDTDYVLTDKDEAIRAEKLPFFAEETDFPLPDAPLPDDVCQITLTSGTTGVPKGVMLTHKNLMCIVNCEFAPLAGSVGIGILPFSHAFEAVCHLLVLLSRGGTIHICPSLMRFAPLVASSGCDCLYLVPALAEALLTRFERFLSSAANLKTVVCGGAMVPDTLRDAYAARGIRLIAGYGLSECSPLVSLNAKGVPGSCGVAGSYNRARVRDGELQIKGDNVMRGYYKNEEATREAFTEDGWLRTGDLGHIDSEGNIFLTGRIKNLIILSNGENVSPEELENLLIARFPAVRDALVYEKHDRLAALLFVPEGEPPRKEELDALNASLPPHQRIAAFDVTAEPLPTSANGKKLRKI